jgi:hypothetical protein
LAVQNFFSRHRRLLTFFGALIVFVTFIVKEAKREQLKSVVDSLEIADGVFAVRQDNYATHSQLSTLQKSFNKFIEKTAAHDEREKRLEIYRLVQDKREVLDERLSRVRSSLDSTKALAAIVPIDNNLKQALSDAQQAYSELLDRNNKINKSLPNLMMAEISVFNDKYRQSNEQVASALFFLEEDARGLQKTADAIAADTLALSEKQKAAAEKSYEHYTLWSYFLYSLGWGLGLLGRLSGIEGIAGEL